MARLVPHATATGTAGARRGAPAVLPQMAPGVGPDYTSQEPLPGAGGHAGNGEIKPVQLGFIKAITQGCAVVANECSDSPPVLALGPRK